MKILAGFIFGLLFSSAAAQLVQSPSQGNKIPLAVVGSLPACAGGTEGTVYGVTDALTPVALSAVVGGGAVHILVYCNGTSWIVG